MVKGRGAAVLKVLTVFGTRPEAIKLAPLIRRLAETPDVVSRVCVTAQHRDMLDQMLTQFGIVPDHDLDLMRPGQGLSDVTEAILRGLAPVLALEQPDLLLVHGDTTTSFAAALAAYYQRIPVGHVEAGLRTGNRLSPWPEEGNRRLTASLATLHFAPTEGARANLVAENVDPAHIVVTGNTVIDALRDAVARVESDVALAHMLAQRFAFAESRQLVLVTSHRRESIGGGFHSIAAALDVIAARADVEIVCPLHPNPMVRDAIVQRLGGRANVHLIAPLDYLPFIALLRRAALVLTDSGGVQEEATALGTPVLVMRAATERTEAVAVGSARLVGTDMARIVAAVNGVLDDPTQRSARYGLSDIYGDGQAAQRIVDSIMAWARA